MELFRKLRKPRFLLAYPLAVWIFTVAYTTRPALRLGIACVLLGELIRLWANGYVGHVKVNRTPPAQGQAKIGHLVTAGPYAFIRHPLYLGSLLIGLGLLVIAGNPWLALVASAAFLVVYRRKMVEEEETLRHEWPVEFALYQEAVPRWLPSWRRYPQRNGRWNWQGILASKELRTLAWVVVLLILLFFREELVQRHRSLLQKHGVEHLFLLGLLIALVLADAVVELRRHRPGRVEITSETGYR